MSVRLSRRFGPFRVTAYEGVRSHGAAYRYDDAEDVLDAYNPNWPKRMAIITGAMAPAWVAFGLGWPLLALALSLCGAVGLISAIRRTELAYGCSVRQFGAWCGSVTAGLALAVTLGMLVQAVFQSY